MVVWASLALAGELFVASGTPVNVWVDTTQVGVGALTAHVTGLSGVHRVQVADANNRVLAETQVQLPFDGVRSITYDGVSLVISAPVATAPMVIVQQQPAPAPPPAPAAPTAMGPGPFNALVGTVRGATYGSDQVAAIRSAAAKNWFTVDQVGTLIDLLTYGSDKVSAVQVCAPKVVDPENAFALGSHFTYSSDKEAALALFQ
jgi:hypothetical protein